MPAEVEEWFQAGRYRLMVACEERNPSIVGDVKKAEEAKQRLAALSTGQDTKGVSFAGDALHHLYFSTKFERRGILLYKILCLAIAKPSIRSSIFRPEGTLLVSSVGGGPGTKRDVTCHAPAAGQPHTVRREGSLQLLLPLRGRVGNPVTKCNQQTDRVGGRWLGWQ